MATFSAKVFKHHKKVDGTYNVKICITHKRERVYFDTEHYVVDKQLTKDLKIKDQFLKSILNKSLDKYRKSVGELDDRVEQFTAENLKQYLLDRAIKIDFLEFAKLHIDVLEDNKQDKHAANFRTVKNHLADFMEQSHCQLN